MTNELHTQSNWLRQYYRHLEVQSVPSAGFRKTLSKAIIFHGQLWSFGKIITLITITIAHIMAFLTDEQLSTLSLDRMIFHVVGPEEGHLVLLEEITPGEHAEFFLARIKPKPTAEK